MNLIFLGLQEVTEQCASHNQTHGSSLLTGCDGVLSGGVSLAEAHICYCCLSGVWPSSPSSCALGILLRESTTLHGVQCTHPRSRVGVGVGVPAVSVGVHNRMCVGLRNKERSLPLTRADEVPRRLPTAGFAATQREATFTRRLLQSEAEETAGETVDRGCVPGDLWTSRDRGFIYP